MAVNVYRMFTGMFTEKGLYRHEVYEVYDVTGGDENNHIWEGTVKGIDSYRDSSVVCISLDWNQLRAITKDYGNGNGGFQRLFQRLNSGISHVYGAGCYLSMHPDDARRVVRYVEKYGQGGWQDALKSIVDDVKRTLGPENLETQHELPWDL